MPLTKLKPTTGASTDDLIAQIEMKDRRFRIAQTTFMVCTFAALIVVIFMLNRTLNGVQDQLAQAKDTAISQDKNANDATNKIIRRLDCMTIFFSQRDRTNLTIQNIDQCTLERDGDIQRFFTNDSDGGTTNNSTEQPEGQQTDPKVPAP